MSNGSSPSSPGRGGGSGDAAAVSGAIRALEDEDPLVVEPEPRADRVHLAGEALHRDEGRDAGVEQQVEETLGAQQRAQRDDDDAGLHRRDVELDQLDRVVEEEPDAVAPDEAETGERVRGAVRPRVEVCVRQPLRCEDERGVVPPVARVPRRQRLEAHTSPQRTTLAAHV